MTLQEIHARRFSDYHSTIWQGLGPGGFRLPNVRAKPTRVAIAARPLHPGRAA